MQYRCLQTWSPLRKSPDSASEMVSSMLFGESCRVLDTQGDWLHVQLTYDGYEGWVPESYLVKTDDSSALWKRVHAHQSAFFSDGISKIHLSAGSDLPDTDTLTIDGRNFYLTIRDPRVPENLWELARGFLFVPYLWGGRSDCGMDCSGLTQVCAKMQAKFLPRDAWQQASVGESVSFAERRPNDLAFFAKNDRITHVGILTAELEIIHASGRVRQDKLNQGGILHSETGLQTHSLVQIRRI